jgi:hypothetical protein
MLTVSGVRRSCSIRACVTAAALAAAPACGGGGATSASHVVGADGAAGSEGGADGGASDAGPLAISVDAPGVRPGTIHMAVPAYFYPGPDWQRLVAAAPTVGMIVFNPNSGPGTAADPNYTQAIMRAEAAGIIVLGYVATSYGQRAEADIVADIDAYYNLYPAVSGIYLAEGPTESDCPGLEDEYRRLVAAAQARDPRAYTAVGTRYCPTYTYFFDLTVQFARDWTEYQSYVPPSWMPANSPERFCHFVNGVPVSAASAALSRAVANGAGWVFVTDEVDPNPWAGLPTYFDDEVRAVQALAR